MKKTRLADNTSVFCLRATEAKMLDYHIKNYLVPPIVLQNGNTILDVGANIGIMGIRLLQQYPDSTVYAFEPIPPTYQVLAANAREMGEKRFIALQYGVSKENGTAVFSYFPNSPALSTAHPEDWDNNKNTLTEAVAGNVRNAPPEFWWAKFIPSFLFKWGAKIMRMGEQKVTCELRTISAIIEQYDIKTIDLLKIDCEGAELDVLLGIAPQHWQRLQQVVVEVHDLDGRLEQVVQLCRNNGISNIKVERDSMMGNTPLYNVFAARL
jgi:FkbM family methyltransferase